MVIVNRGGAKWTASSRRGRNASIVRRDYSLYPRVAPILFAITVGRSQSLRRDIGLWDWKNAFRTQSWGIRVELFPPRRALDEGQIGNDKGLAGQQLAAETAGNTCGVRLQPYQGGGSKSRNVRRPRHGQGLLCRAAERGQPTWHRSRGTSRVRPCRPGRLRS